MLLLTAALLLCAAGAMAQQLSNVRALQEGKMVVVRYDLTGGASGQEYEVRLWYAQGSGPWQQATKGLEGDIGPKVKDGTGKEINWLPLQELGRLSGTGFRFKVTATYTDPFPAPIQKLLSDMVRIEGGSFMMGCSAGDSECGSDEKPAHRVTVSGFSMGRYEVTRAQWRAVTGSDPSHNKGCDNCPVERVSWNDIVNDFIPKLNRMTGKVFRLPTEAEWEYAARGGTTARFHTGNCLSTSQANYDGNYPAIGCGKGEYRQKTVPVGSFAPNGFGLYDMSGSVWEWCSDWFGSYSSSTLTDPRGPSTGSIRVLRGGCWDDRAWNCRVSYRFHDSPDLRFNIYGFRVALQ